MNHLRLTRRNALLIFAVATLVIGGTTGARSTRLFARTPGTGPSPMPTDPLKDVPRETDYVVSGVTDGDTIQGTKGDLERAVSNQDPGAVEFVEVKLAGIDAYEMSGSPGHDLGHCAGVAAFAGLTVFLEKGPNFSDGWKDVVLVRDPTQPDRDKIGRLVRYVYLKDGTYINKKMIREGLATNWDGKHARSAEFAEAEKSGQASPRAKQIKDQCANNPKEAENIFSGRVNHQADFVLPNENWYK